MSDKIGLPDRKKTAFVLIDIQERLLPVIFENERVIKNTNILIEGRRILDIPLLVTEQYPKGLGHTDPNINLPEEKVLVEKMCFSCIASDDFMGEVKKAGAKTLVLFGIEAHICVLKTALEALAEGYQVHVVSDAVSSRTEDNKKVALERMRQAGAFITSTEMILFQMMDYAGTDQFKAISRLIK